LEGSQLPIENFLVPLHPIFIILAFHKIFYIGRIPILVFDFVTHTHDPPTWSANYYSLIFQLKSFKFPCLDCYVFPAWDYVNFRKIVIYRREGARPYWWIRSFPLFPTIRGNSKFFDNPITYFLRLSPSTAFILFRVDFWNNILLQPWLSNIHFPSENFSPHYCMNVLQLFSLSGIWWK